MLLLRPMWDRTWSLALGLLVASTAGAAQEWNSDATKRLVQAATERRSRQLADSSLADYTATARGYLTFLAQLGGRFLPPKVVKADQLELEVYWKAPNYSKQWIVGRRDTLLLPTDIQYHRDHLGIVQNNFPDIIRLGDGDEVRDVPHPLSVVGLATYDYAVSDSLRIQIPGRVLDVIEVKVRPRNDRVPAAVGALYIAKDDAQVVRMAFSFTRVALKDPQLEDVSIVLENSLIEERYWLPRRQEIEIRRSGTYLDFPVQGIIRGRWEIRDYKVNAGGTVALSPGDEIQYAPPGRRARHQFPPTRILDSLPEGATLLTDEELLRVQQEARRLVRAQALARATSTRPSARHISDLAQVNRVEGFALGAGLRRQLGHGVDVLARGRYGIADERWKGAVSLGKEWAGGVALRATLFDDFREAGDQRETSRVRNSIAAQEFGEDNSEFLAARGASFGVTGTWRASWRWALETSRSRERALEVHAISSFGSFAPTLAADNGRASRFTAAVERPALSFGKNSSLSLRVIGELGQFVPTSPSSSLGRSTVVRGFAVAQLAHPALSPRFVARASLGGVSGSDGIPLQSAVFAGGPVSAPGYAYHRFVGTGISTLHLEGRSTVPFLSLPLGRYGKVPATLTLAPYAGMAAVAGSSGERGAFPYAGLGFLTGFDVLRVDVARGLRRGTWRFGLDLTADFWSIL